MLDVTDLVDVVLGLLAGTAVEEEGMEYDSCTFFFLGIAPVLLLGAYFASIDVFIDDSKGRFVTVDDEVDSDDMTAVVDILLILFSLDSIFDVKGAKPIGTDDP